MEPLTIILYIAGAIAGLMLLWAGIGLTLFLIGQKKMKAEFEAERERMRRGSHFWN